MIQVSALQKFVWQRSFSLLSQLFSYSPFETYLSVALFLVAFPPMFNACTLRHHVLVDSSCPYSSLSQNFSSLFFLHMLVHELLLFGRNYVNQLVTYGYLFISFSVKCNVLFNKRHSIENILQKKEEMYHWCSTMKYYVFLPFIFLL